MNIYIVIELKDGQIGWMDGCGYIKPMKSYVVAYYPYTILYYIMPYYAINHSWYLLVM